jgi:hypothetical protein
MTDSARTEDAEIGTLKYAIQALSLKVGTPAFDYDSPDETYETKLLTWIGSQWKYLCDRAQQEATLAADLRVTQDQVIERCAQAIQEKWPEAAKVLRAHVDGISGEDWGELNRRVLAAERERDSLREALGDAEGVLAAIHDAESGKVDGDTGIITLAGRGVDEIRRVALNAGKETTK